MSSQLRIPGRMHSFALHTTAPVHTLAPVCKADQTVITPTSRLSSLPSPAPSRGGFRLQATIPRLTPFVRTNCPRIAAMSTMRATQGHNEACCNIPPVVSSGYIPKGSYEEISGLKTYITGPADATTGIISIFDIFGYFDQTLQGADILGKKHKVFIPDWFKGNPCPIEWYPPDTEEKQKLLGAWFGEHSPQSVAAILPSYFKEVAAANPAIKSWTLLGYCWGGKVVELISSAPSNPFAAGVAIHPAMVDPAGAKDISVPFMLLASMEEPADVIAEFEGNLKGPCHVETFKDQVHGWMAARADLSDPRVKEEYTRGYKTILEFLGKQLG